MRWIVSVLIIVSLAGVACTPVKPWQRSRLMGRCMTGVLDPMETSLEIHMLRTREAMLGGETGGGVSCGCN